jgi:hypothetical protein
VQRLPSASARGKKLNEEEAKFGEATADLQVRQLTMHRHIRTAEQHGSQGGWRS